MSARNEYPIGRCKAPGVHLWAEQYDAMCDEIDELRETLASIWLYVDWRYVTKQLTTEQKELWLAAIAPHVSDVAEYRWWA